ncbi:hypothetical protein N2152v2_010246 [Parachlorella kessleri]
MKNEEALAPFSHNVRRERQEEEAHSEPNLSVEACDRNPKSSKKTPKLERYLGLEEAREAAAAGWTKVASLQDFVSKPIKAIILDDGKAVCVYKVGDNVYCSDANSTAYQYPLVDASILKTKGGPAVEVGLDGTTYDLATGKVLSWCPKNTLGRKILGALKDRSSPVDLPVYPARVEGQDVLVKLS